MAFVWDPGPFFASVLSIASSSFLSIKPARRCASTKEVEATFARVKVDNTAFISLHVWFEIVFMALELLLFNRVVLPRVFPGVDKRPGIGYKKDRYGQPNEEVKQEATGFTG